MAEKKYRIAAATADGRNVDVHFGRAENFAVYDADDQGGIHLAEYRKTRAPCQGGSHQDADLAAAAELLADCDYIIAAKAGPGAQAALAERGIQVCELPGDLLDAIDRLLLYLDSQEQIQNFIQELQES